MMSEDIEKHLETKLEQIENKLRGFDSARDESPESISEIGTFSWHLQTRETGRAMHEHLSQLRENLEKSLARIRDGAYGICEDCGERIEEERLRAMPTAALCVTCK